MDGTLCSNKQKTNSLQRAAFMDGSAHGIKAVRRSSGKLEKLNSQSSSQQEGGGVRSRKMGNIFANATQKV